MRQMMKWTRTRTDGRTDGNHEAPVDLTAPLQVKMFLGNEMFSNFSKYFEEKEGPCFSIEE